MAKKGLNVNADTIELPRFDPLNTKEQDGSRREKASFNTKFGKYVVDIDMGGTHTDAIISRKGQVAHLKVDTTPHDLGQCFKNVLEKGSEQLGLGDLRTFLHEVQVIRLSTSLSTNAIVERKGGRIGLLLSKGWRTPYLDQFQHNMSERALVLPDMAVEIEEGFTDEEIREKAYRLLTGGSTFLVVSLDGYARFSTAEERVKSIINRYFAKHFIGSMPILISSQLSRDDDYLKRTNSAVLNAYTHEDLARQLLGLEDFLRDNGYACPLLVVHASGGSARVAKSHPIQTISSGAAAGIYGALRLSEIYGEPHMITADVGGTSTEIGLIRHHTIDYPAPARIEGLPIDAPSPVSSTMGVGGGSIVRIDKNGKILLGPDSAGAFPGPVCYNLGGTAPTLTDAYLILGYFDEGYFLGGEKRIQREIAEKAVKREVSDPLGITCEEAALMIKKKAVEIIGGRIQRIISSTDCPASAFSLVAVGGGGGCIGSEVAGLAGIPKTYLFRQGPVFGAFGSSGMDIMHQYRERIRFALAEGDASLEEIFQRINGIVLGLQRTAARDMSGEGFKPEEIRFEVELELESIISAKSARLCLSSPFLYLKKDRQYLKERIADLFIEDVDNISLGNFFLTSIIVRALGDIPHATPITPIKVRSVASTKRGRRSIYVEEGNWVDARVYIWDDIAAFQEIEGPALIENRYTTVLVPPRKTIEFDENTNGVIKG